MEIGQVIKEIREKRGLSQSDISRMTGLKRNTVHYIERGTNPAFDKIARIARALGLSLDTLAAVVIDDNKPA